MSTKKPKAIKSIQIGLAVRDAKAKLEGFKELFELDESTINIIDTTKIGSETFYKGKEIDMEAIIITLDLGGLEIEIIEPKNESGDLYSDFIVEHGEGIHHLSIQYDDLQGQMDFMESKGIDKIGHGLLAFPSMDTPKEERRDIQYNYFDTLDLLGMMIETTIYPK